jgi:ParB/RepB/Spo0J family partition protein
MTTNRKLDTTPEKTQAQALSKRAQAKGQQAVNALAQRLSKLTVEYVPVDSVFPNSYNPNRQTEKDFNLLMKSITDDGFTTPILCLRRTREIIDGEHRWRAALKLGMKEIPVVFTDMTPEQMRMSTLRHNQARGTHDMDLEADMLRDLQQIGALDWAADALLMDDDDLNRLLSEVPIPEQLAGEEFGQAWVPAPFVDDGKITPSVDAAQGDSQTDTRIVQAFTPGAVKAQAEYESKLSTMTAPEEGDDRKKLARESNLYRINLVFTQNEAVIVEQALGPQPAVKLVDMCAARLAKMTGPEAVA